MAKKEETSAAADIQQTDETSAQIHRKTAKDENDDGFYCYVGPSITGLIQHGTIYVGSRRQALVGAAAAIEKNPIIKTLIVSGNKLPEVRLKIKTPGNALYENYQRIAGKA